MTEFLARCSEWLFYPAFVSFLLCFLLIPFLIWMRTRGWTSVVVMFSSIVMGLYVFITGCYVTLFFLGWFWFAIVFLFFGIGPSVVGTFLLFWHHENADAIYMLIALVSVFAWRGISSACAASIAK